MIKTQVEGNREKLELMVNDESVSQLTIVDLNMKVGSATVRIGGIAGVSTKPEQRNRGYARQLLTDSIEIMRDRGFDMSMLFGIPNFYYRFGFISVIPDYKMEIPTRAAERAARFYETNPMRPEDIPSILDLYHRYTGNRTGSIVRDASTWKGFRLGSTWTLASLAVVIRSGDRILGYAAYDNTPEDINVTEITATDDDGYSTLLKFFADLAVERRTAMVNVFAPPDHPFAYFCRRFGYTIHTTFHNCRAGMGRIINIMTTFEKLQPELGLRLRGSGMNESGALGISTDIGDILLLIDNGRLRVKSGCSQADYILKIDQSQLTTLIMGYKRVGNLAHELKLNLPRRYEVMLEAMFPAGYPYLGLPDRF